MSMDGDGRFELADIMLGSGDALFLDFDGTLADIVNDPDDARLGAGAEAALETLAGALGGALVVLSGRGLADLARRTPAGLWRAGGHGLEIAAPGQTPAPRREIPPPTVLAPLEVAAARPGVRLEIKGPMAALHFRADPAAEVDCLAAAREAAATPGYVAQAGKMVVEVKPQDAHKGRALLGMLDKPPFRGRRPVMIGDDVTDEDAIAAAQSVGGLGVKVGHGPTAARGRACDPAAVRAWLAAEAARVGR